MKPAWALVACLIACGPPPLADDEPASTSAAATSTGVDDPTLATSGGEITTSANTGDASDTTASDICDPALVACTGEQAWLRAFPVTGDAFLGNPIDAAALAVAANGDIVATGLYGGTIAFGDDKITSIGALDLWVARFAPDGAPIWFRRFGGPDPTPDEGYGGANWSSGNIAFEANGDILLTARCVDTIDLGFGPLAGEDLDPVVLRLSADGQPIWAHRHVGLGGISNDYPLLIAPVGDGRLWLAGTLYGPAVDLGGGLLHSAGWGDVLIAQIDADGEHLWSRRAGDPGHQDLRSIAPTPDGGLVIAGNLEGSLDLGDGPLVSAGTRDAFVAHLDGDGQPTWAHRYGDNHSQVSLAVRVDGVGGIVLAGDFESSIDLGGGPFTTPKIDADPYPGETWSNALFFARLAPDGAHAQSTALLGAHGSLGMWSFDRGADGTLVLTGAGTPDLTFPGGISGSGEGFWVTALGPDASPRWQHILAADLIYSVPRVVASPNGAAIVALTIYGEVEFDGVSIGTPDQHTLILAQFGV